MKRLILFLCAMVSGACAPRAAATLPPGPRAVTLLSVVKTSGPVRPQWSEQVDITWTSIQLRRTGEPGTPVNAGEWAIEVDAAAVGLLFERLGEVDCAQIQPILPEEVPDGGGSVAYEVRYDDGSTCAVWYHDGITYSGAEPLVNATEEFLAGLTLPDDAARFALSP